MENIEKQSNEKYRNPSRNNTNVNQGQSNEKRFNTDSATNVDDQTNPEQRSEGEVSLNRGGVSDSSGSEASNFSSGEEKGEGKLSGEQQTGQGLSGTSNTGPQVYEQQAQEQNGSLEKKNQSQLGTGGQGQRLMGEDKNDNRNSGTAPGSDIDH